MALTMTRTRTQTTLNKLAEMLANINGEVAFVEGLLMRTEGAAAEPVARMGLVMRLQKLAGDRAALCATIRQFDPMLAPEDIGESTDWKLRFGRRGLGATTFTQRYLRAAQ